MQGPCVGCGAAEDLQIHHVRKLGALNLSASSVQNTILALGRKQVPVCLKCHTMIHKGSYDKNHGTRKAI